VQIFDREGNYKRQFGSEGSSADGQFDDPSALASDAHGNLLVLDRTNRLQVFSPEGKHLCTRNDLTEAKSIAWSDAGELGLKSEAKSIAWSDAGELAIAEDDANRVLIWHNEYQRGLKEGGEVTFDWVLGVLYGEAVLSMAVVLFPLGMDFCVLCFLRVCCALPLCSI
jgi:hypothetical protein